ncbi:uncharacterized protein METZ01_LOCUS69607 [marine metagenome]|uniref:Uncharacterized protein n=1 Tax=marine metagenome TaxID=408172 RepID=A0A381TRR6_9ZZZZ
MRFPSAFASLASSGDRALSHHGAATWEAPYGVPPVRVSFKPGSVYGIPAHTMP